MPATSLLNVMIIASSFHDSVSSTAMTASFARPIRPAEPIEPETSTRITTFFGPDAADEYHGRNRGS